MRSMDRNNRISEKEGVMVERVFFHARDRPLAFLFLTPYTITSIKIKSLQSEYAELLAQKKNVYPEYRKLQAEMKDLLTVKANVDRLLNQDERPPQEEQQEKPR